MGRNTDINRRHTFALFVASSFAVVAAAASDLRRTTDVIAATLTRTTAITTTLSPKSLPQAMCTASLLTQRTPD
eukprot:3161892-Pleurochrysis_carterae.AAC.5